MINKQDILRRYMSWCLDQAREELEAGMPNLSWVGHPAMGFLAEYLHQKPVTEAIELISALQYRKLCCQGLEWEAGKRIQHEAMLEDFMHAGDAYDSQHVQEFYEAMTTGKFKIASSSIIKRLTWKTLRSKNWKKIPWNPGIIKCTKEVSHLTVNTYLSAEGKEFTYSQEVISDAGEILLETSFAEWFGLGYDTMFMENERGSEERISDFVVEKCELFAAALTTLVDPDSG